MFLQDLRLDYNSNRTLVLLQANARVESKTDAEMGVKLTEAISQALIKFHMRKLKGVS